MARKRDLEKRNRLLAEAFDVICARGVHNTTMKDLASELGIPRSSFYWYVSDLGAVFQGALERTFTDVGQRVSALLAARHPIDVLSELTRILVAFHGEERETIIVMFQLWAVGGAKDPEVVLETGHDFLEMLRRTLATLVQAGIDEGLVGDDVDPADVVDATLAFVDGMLVQRIIRGPDADLNPPVEFFIERVLDSCRTTKPS